MVSDFRYCNLLGSINNKDLDFTNCFSILQLSASCFPCLNQENEVGLINLFFPNCNFLIHFGYSWPRPQLTWFCSFPFFGFQKNNYQLVFPLRASLLMITEGGEKITFFFFTVFPVTWSRKGNLTEFLF